MILVMGLPSAGKTAYSKRFASVLHYDDISSKPMRERYATYAASDAECFEGVHNTRSGRKAMLEVGKGEKVCIFIDTPIDVCLERERKGRNRGDALVLHHARTLEPPTYDEGWDEIWIVRGNELHHLERQAKEESCDISYPISSMSR